MFHLDTPPRAWVICTYKKIFLLGQCGDEITGKTYLILDVNFKQYWIKYI